MKTKLSLIVVTVLAGAVAIGIMNSRIVHSDETKTSTSKTVQGMTPAVSPSAKQPTQQNKPPRTELRALTFHRLSPSEQKITASMDAETLAEFVDTPLSDVTTFLSELHDIPIILDEFSLQEQGISTDAPVSMSFASSLKNVLANLLEPLKLDYIVANDVLKIVPRKVADERLEVRVYETRHLEDVKSEELAEVVQETVAVGTWAQSGGKAAVKSLNGCLVVSQSQRGHRAVTDLLEQLARHTQIGD
ncbi:MAG: hypothetical protein CMJ78_21735 [Planctomycetaceae bacterium]|nr:hypothetical protein [Planctomycetaceae bacterium]